ncbi:MAG: chloride channel protein [Ktedonobacterales bacterium]
MPSTSDDTPPSPPRRHERRPGRRDAPDSLDSTAPLRQWRRSRVWQWLQGTSLEDSAINPASATATRSTLGDFTTDGRTIYISALAVIVGVLAAFVTVILISLIGFITNVAYYHRWSFKLVSPAHTALGWWAAIIHVAGGLIVGLMARFGSERIRGHGIPEALETIAVGGSRIEPSLVLLKPTSSAIAIGTGGPFGAEGPIILTGGALGSVLGQLFKLTAAERKTLLVAGAAAGMTGIFNAPIASVLLAVELMLFEFKPRSLVPVALATVTSTILRRSLIGSAYMFPLGPHPTLGTDGVIAAGVVGIFAGILSWLLTLGIYGMEDVYRKLPVHWMWWPALGGIVVGIGGVIFPLALGVGYDTISAELAGKLTISLLVGVLVFKSILWVVALSSGTSGGILAPVLLIGGAMGGIMSGVLPTHSMGLWSLIAMAATLGALTNAPLTGVIFALETSGALDTLLPLLAACTTAYLFVVLVLRRSILTEKVARRGFHLSREYAVDPLEVLSAREVMLTDVVTLAADLPVSSLRGHPLVQVGSGSRRLYPIVDAQGQMLGVLTRADVARLAISKGGDTRSSGSDSRTLGDVMRSEVVVAYPDETLRSIAARMVDSGVWRVPVVSRTNPRQVVGILSQRELLRARQHLLEEERHRERIFRLRMLSSRGQRDASGPTAEVTKTHAVPEGARSDEVVTTGDGVVTSEGSQSEALARSTDRAVIQQSGSVTQGDARPGPTDV